MKYKYQYKNKIAKGYIGDNVFAAKAHNIKFHHKCPEHTMEILKGLPKRVRLNTEHHEPAETYRIKQLIKLGYTPKQAYHIAHYHFALPFEKLNRPFPKTNIKRTLIKWKFNQ